MAEEQDAICHLIPPNLWSMPPRLWYNNIEWRICSDCDKPIRKAKNGWERHLIACLGRERGVESNSDAGSSTTGNPEDERSTRDATSSSVETEDVAMSPSKHDKCVYYFLNWIVPVQKSHRPVQPDARTDSEPLALGSEDSASSNTESVNQERGRSTTSFHQPTSLLGPFDIHTELHSFTSSSARNQFASPAEFIHSHDDLIWPFKTREEQQS